MPRPLTAESSEELEEPSSSQLAHEDEKVPQKCMIQLDDVKIERENKKVCCGRQQYLAESLMQIELYSEIKRTKTTSKAVRDRPIRKPLVTVWRKARKTPPQEMKV